MKAKVALMAAVAMAFLHHARPAAGGCTIERVAVQSSTIVSAGYAKETRMLEIEFRSGEIYRYRQVPESVYTALSAARSKGRFFGAEIRGKFPYEKLKGAAQ